MTQELADGDLDTPCKSFMVLEYQELGFVQEGCLGGAFYLFWSVADEEIVKTFCLANPIEL